MTARSFSRAAWLAAFMLGSTSLAAPSLAASPAPSPRPSVVADRDFEMPAILDLRRQAEVRDAWLVKRLDTVVPMLMRREGIDTWLLIAREYTEDPVVRTMLPSTWLSARRRTILLFHDPGDGRPVERLSVSRYPPGEWFTSAWTPEDEPDQWQRLAKLIAERDPARIAVSRSPTFPLADGLTATEDEALRAALGPTYAARLVPGERLAIGWLETRIPEEMAVYPTIVRIANAIIAEGFSERVITPGVTTTADVQWWFRERIRGLGLVPWFHPTVGVQRAEAEVRPMTTMFASRRPDLVIQPGDLLHVDLGIVYLGLATDTQNHAYVLRPGETDAPAGLRAGLADANRLQDILMRNFRVGESGNALLARARREALAAGLVPTIYSHALGFHGHGAGPWIGMWDNQDGAPGPGEYPVHADTVWAIELNAERAVPEWGGRKIRFMLEEDAFFDGRTVRFLDGRQERFHLIPRAPAPNVRIANE
jgi:Xaa-Pro aminopeptidase